MCSKGIDWDNVTDLGKVVDREIAERFDVAINVVSTARQRRGIKSFQKSQQVIDCHDSIWDTVGLGQKPDSIIAKQLNVSRRTVCRQRKKRHISAFVGIILTQEGLPCRSIYEAIYDAFLHWKQISHQHEVPLPDLHIIADFLIGSQVVEITAMMSFKKYEKRNLRKREAYRQAAIFPTWLTAEDVLALYSRCPVEICFREKRICTMCGKVEYDLVKGYCRPCYMKYWHDKHGITLICKQCGITFNGYGKYCSHVCYSKSLEHKWPSWEWIDKAIKHKSIRQVAHDIGVKDTSLYMRIRRRIQRNGTLVDTAAPNIMSDFARE